MTNKIIVIYLIIILYPVTCFGSVYYVSQYGSGKMDGSSVSNLMSITTHNKRIFKPGDIIKLCGNINETVVINSNGTEGNYISYTGNCEVAAGAIITNQEIGIKIVNHKYVRITNININALKEGIVIYGGSNHIIIDSCNIHDTLARGIFVTDITKGNSPSSNINVVNNIIHDTGAGTAGADISMAYVIDFNIRNNQLYATKNDGMPSDRGIDGIVLANCSNGVIEYNDIHDHNDSYYNDPLGEKQGWRTGKGEDGIDVKVASKNITIRFNHIYNQKFQTGITVQMDSENINIYGNYIHDNLWAGILLKDANKNSQFYKNLQPTNNIFIVSNLITNNKKRGISIESRGDGVKNVKIFNNLIAKNSSAAQYTPDSGILIEGGGHFQIINNIFYQNYTKYKTFHQIFVEKGVSNLSIKNNLFFVSGHTASIFLDGQKKPLNSDFRAKQNINADPLIKTNAFSLYSLDKQSPCYRKGIPLGASYDIAINPNNTNWDDLTINISHRGDAWDIGPFFIPDSEITLSAPKNIRILSVQN